MHNVKASIVFRHFRKNYFKAFNCIGYFLVSSVIIVIYIKTSNPREGDIQDASEFLHRHRAKELDKEQRSQLEVAKYIKFYNLMGHAGTSLQTLEDALKDEDDSFKRLILSRSLRARGIARKISNKTDFRLSATRSGSLRTKINLATVACSKSTVDVMVMLKSAVMFSRDASLHMIIFGDKTLPLVAEMVLELKWTVNTLGWDFTYELQSVWFPKERSEEWKQMYALCATQRLFFPSLLPHIDSLIYLDADSVVVSNLTDFWEEFKGMNGSHVAGIAPNTEFPANGFYNLHSTVPYYGQRGLNAGIMMMNLTRLRNFDFENKALATYTLYKENIQLADQDILNIIFHAFPEKLWLLDCTYNFIWSHCGEPDSGPGSTERVCLYEKQPGSICFCSSSQQHGIRIAHGNSGTFHKSDYPLFRNLYRTMYKFNLKGDSYSDLLSKLIEDFNSLDRPCFSLTGEKMYENAKIYFQNLELIGS